MHTIPSFDLLEHRTQLLRFEHQMILRPRGFFYIVCIVKTDFPIIFRIDRFLRRFQDKTFRRRLGIVEAHGAFNQGSLYKVILLIRIDIEASPQHFDIQIADLHDKRMFPVLGNLEVPLALQTGDTLSVDIGVGQRAFRIQFDRTLIRQGQLHLISGRNFRQERRVRILQFMQKRKVPRRNGQDGNHGRRHHDTGPAHGDFRRMYLQTKSPMNFPLTTDFHRRINRILIPKRFHPFGQFLVRKMIQGLLEALEVFPIGLSP